MRWLRSTAEMESSWTQESLRKTERTTTRQSVYYDPGGGTLARPDPWQKLRQDFDAALC